MMIDKVSVDGHEFDGHLIKTSAASILLIKGTKGFLGCGYFKIETANKLHEAVAIVTGVKCYTDMLNAKVVEVSSAAAELGINIGCSGRDALLKMV